MHELSIAQNLVDVVQEQLRVRSMGERVLSITVEVGALSGVVGEALKGAFASAALGTPLADAALHVQPVAPVGYCPACGGERAARSIQHLRCIDCDTPLPRLVRGRELELISIEVADETQNA